MVPSENQFSKSFVSSARLAVPLASSTLPANTARSPMRTGAVPLLHSSSRRSIIGVPSNTVCTLTTRGNSVLSSVRMPCRTVFSPRVSSRFSNETNAKSKSSVTPSAERQNALASGWSAKEKRVGKSSKMFSGKPAAL